MDRRPPVADLAPRRLPSHFVRFQHSTSGRRDNPRSKMTAGRFGSGNRA